MVTQKTMLSILTQYKNMLVPVGAAMGLSQENINKLITVYNIAITKVNNMSANLRDDQINYIANLFIEIIPEYPESFQKTINSMLKQFEVAKERYILTQTGVRTEKDKKLEKANHEKFARDLQDIWEKRTKPEFQTNSSPNEDAQEEKAEEDAVDSKYIL